MAKLRTNEIESYLKKPQSAHRLILVFGPDHGLVVERGKALVKATGVDMNDPFALIPLDVASLDSHPGRLVDEAGTLSMFGGIRTIWLRNVGTEKSVAQAVSLALENPSDDTLIIVEAGDLKPSSPLRKTVEAHAKAVAIPCYADDARSLQTLLDQVTAEFGLSLEMDARQALMMQLGGDRLASRGEVEKLCLYAKGNGNITLEDVEAIVGDVSDKPIGAAIDAVLAGNSNSLDDNLNQLFASKTVPFVLISSLMREFRSLATMRATIDMGRSISSVVDAARPPIFFKRKDMVTRALSSWSGEALGRALMRIENAILETRQKGAPEEAITRNLFLALCVETARGFKGRR